MKLGDLPDVDADAMLLAIRSELVAQRAAFVHLLDMLADTGGPSGVELAARLAGKTISFPSGAIAQSATNHLAGIAESLTQPLTKRRGLRLVDGGPGDEA